MSASSSFGRWVRRRRKTLDLTQAQLARRVGCAEVTIQKIEADERRPSRRIAERLADQLDIAPSDRRAFLQTARAELASDQLAPPDVADAAPASAAGALTSPRPLLPLPSGTLTFLFTDIVGSSQRWEQGPTAMQAAVARHDTILRTAIAAHRGTVFKIARDGFNAAFATVADALAAAVAAQLALALEVRGPPGALRVRMALHTGMAEERDGEYFGPPLDRVARLLAAGHGGQILLSRATVELVRDQLPTGLALRDLGTHRLKDLSQPEHIFQLIAPDLQADFPPLKTFDRQLGGLPPQPTSFLGRDTERMLLRVLFRRADVRLLTLSGPGGTGKTRLAIEAAAELRDDFADGVAFVGLAAISDPALVIPTIAKALGVIDSGDQPLLERVSDALHDKQLLLVLDNFEHVLAAAPDISALLTSAPGLKVIATSRAALHLAWEREFPVPPLAVPNRSMSPSPGQLQQYDAVSLFLTRVRNVYPDFDLTEDNSRAVAEICRRLDGLPLAIELAAARIKLFPPQALLARLDHRLTVLTGGPRDRPVRQQTLRATIDWSYNLLEPWEQTLFERLSVFVSGCTIAAAEDIATVNVESERSLVLDGLTALVDKSLLRRSTDLEGEPRFVMLETIREYALERLAAGGEWEPIRRRHAEVFLALAESAAAGLEGAEQGAWLDRLQQEHDNLRAALDWVVAQKETAIGLRLATALRLFWFMRGYLTEGRERLAQVLALGDGAASARARALDCAGFLARYQGDYSAAAGLIGEGLALWRDLGHRQGVADALSNLGYVALHQGDYATARTLYEESLDLQRELGNAQGRADCLSHLGTAAFYQGDEAGAQALHGESLSIWRALGDVEGVAYALNHLGDLAVSQGNVAGAARRFAEGLAASVELGWPWGIVSAVEGAAGLASSGGRPQIALQLVGFSARLRKTVAIPLSAARAQMVARRLAPARRALSESEAAAALAAGEALALEQAVAASFAELAIGAEAAAAGPPGPTSAEVGGLTAREREVAALIAAGHSNRAIAAALVVGVKTVEAHITRILTKLGFSSRAQIAAWAVARGLAPAPEDLESLLRAE